LLFNLISVLLPQPHYSHVKGKLLCPCSYLIKAKTYWEQTYSAIIPDFGAMEVKVSFMSQMLHFLWEGPLATLWIQGCVSNSVGDCILPLSGIKPQTSNPFAAPRSNSPCYNLITIGQVLSSGMWYCIIRWKFSTVSVEYAETIFKIKQSKAWATNSKQVESNERWCNDVVTI
jgi:hypothetical protein